LRLLLIYIFFSLIFLNASFAQHFAVEKFATNRDLPTNEVYTMVEDERGAKWLASDGGLIRIIGKDIKVFTIKDGLQESVVLNLFLGFNSEVWYCTLTGYIGYFKNDSLFSLPTINNSIQDLLKKKIIIGSMGFEKDKTYLALNDRSLVEINRVNNQLKVIYTLDSNEVQDIYYSKGNLALNGPLEQNNKVNHKIIHSNNIVKNIMYDDFVANGQRLIRKLNQYYFTTSYKGLTVFHDNTYQRIAFNSRIMSLNILDTNLILVGCINDGLYLIENEKISHLPNFNYSVTGLLIDREGVLWISTIEDGLFIVKNIKTLLNFQTNQVIRGFTSNPTELELLIDNKTVIDAHQDTLYKSGYKNNTVYDKSYFFYNGIRKNIVTVNGVNLDKIYTRQSARLFQGNKIFPVANQAFLVFKHFNVIYVSGSLKVLDSVSISSKPVQTINVSRNISLIAYNSGLCKITFGVDKIAAHNDIYNKRVICMDTIAGNFILGTADYGVKIIDINGKLLQSLDKFPLRIENVKHYKNYIIANSKQNIYLFNLLNDAMKIFNKNNFLPFPNVNFLKVLNDTVWLANNRSLIGIAFNDLANYQPSLKIGVKIELNENSIGKSSNKYLKVFIDNYSTKAFNTCIYYISIIKNGFIYRLDTIERLEFETILPSGKYSISVQAMDKLTGTKSTLATSTFIIPKAYYETWWFILVCLLTAFLLIYLVFKWRIGNVRKVEVEKRNILNKVTLLEAESLQSQMNPHFIFNAINSIQEFILKSDVVQAQSYLSDFAKLIRMVLNHNRLKRVTLAEEITLLNLYIRLESLRLKSPITLDVNNISGFEAEKLVLPAMLLQPIIENAIWHGLKNSPTNKHLMMRFELVDKELHIYILDNGIGIQDLQTLHQSHALSIVKKRLSILNGRTEQIFSIQNRKDISGVEVQLILPIMEIIKEDGSH
jgi:hypothetical protein